MSIEFSNYSLRDLSSDDLPIVLKWRNSDRIRANMYTDHIITMAEHEAWFNRMRKDNTAVSKVFQHFGEPIGTINFTQIDYIQKTCSWGFYLGKEDLKPGTGTIMGRLGIKFVFEELELHRICGEAFAFNQASISFHQKLGFKEDLDKYSSRTKNGVEHKIRCFYLNKDEYDFRS
ncbi:UDP-4-amino-4,6-dideoxy-N-acetyl-beta-L-altrosamine N-acetyltransferase [Paenibacillus abyssi]|uniref:N-acetyltransferase domain-containing protein n=1 Tax=Paenibacillus abyssi TaxID=1340531 RepID=A0A917FLR0_9BACL|nr:UDP-4-amino-4,6-dideoxy-N-acetyl-beta-L-altrosamine N-acetyltransferase [Paenibacillus abyssi]GGF91417.1 hypothetical protein GCM10010916_05860 [Paenibacillus abyssi]